MIRAVLLFMCLALPLRAEEVPALHAVTGIAADDVLNIRAEPDAEAPVIGSLAPDATGVEVVATVGDWAVVNTDDISGYVALRFLQRDPGPDWNALQSPLACLGTEPFWSLKIDSAARQTTFQTPEMAEPETSPLTGVWPAVPWSRTAALALPQGIAVLQPMDCSDGMSERSYGIAVDIFLSGGDRSRLSGCCSLALP